MKFNIVTVISFVERASLFCVVFSNFFPTYLVVPIFLAFPVFPTVAVFPEFALFLFVFFV